MYAGINTPTISSYCGTVFSTTYGMYGAVSYHNVYYTLYKRKEYMPSNMSCILCTVHCIMYMVSLYISCMIDNWLLINLLLVYDTVCAA